MAECIDAFSGPNHFLSNFSEAEVWYEGDSYPTVEHAYQAAKTTDDYERQSVRISPTPGVAKKRGRRVTLRADWERIKENVMYDLVRQKFRSHPGLAAKLVATGDARLVEGNWWGDTYWGVCKGEGQNRLGKILISVRQELKAEYD